MTDHSSRRASWKWAVCGLLLLATMLNYMDRQTLSLTITDISRELQLSNEQYGNLETGFGLAFAAGGLFFGLLADRVSVRWLYPFVFAGWSCAGVATAFAATLGSRVAGLLGPLLGPEWSSDTSTEAYLGLIVCRTALGFFEAGHWPCALITTQRLLDPADRPFGNSLLQSGASIGAIFTPLVVQSMVSNQIGSWRGPFIVIGIVGMIWIVPWLAMIRRRDLQYRVLEPQAGDLPTGNPPPVSPVTAAPPPRSPDSTRVFVRRYVALVIAVIMINLTWQYFRVWLPKFLREFHEYDRTAVNYFVSAYYIATDVGCIGVGIAVKMLTARSVSVHTARMGTFLFCALLAALSTVASILPRGGLLLTILLFIGCGTLGLFPNYYAFTQELSRRRQGAVTGTLGAITWIVTSIMQKYVGRSVDATGSYATAIFWVGLAPLLAWLALAILWGKSEPQRTAGEQL